MPKTCTNLHCGERIPHRQLWEAGEVAVKAVACPDDVRMSLAGAGRDAIVYLLVQWTTQCVAVIPCYNEAPFIGALIAEIRQYLTHVIVVDDGSTDGTAFKARAAGAEVICRGRNGGKGAALRAGWWHACQRGFTWVLMMDGDGQHAPADIPKFFARAKENGAVLVVGDRMANSEAMPWLRRHVNRWMSRRLSALAGIRLLDSQCGFRLAHLETLTRLPLSARRFEIESETLVTFLAAGLRVEFVPIRVIYESERSNICPFRDTWRWLRWWAAQPSFCGQNYGSD
jgi:glycosyltransferase involved in cell wall biosynthesis